jgi:predicted PurR-regulated permease PerM
MGRPARPRPPNNTGLPLGQRIGWSLLFIAIVTTCVWVLWPIFSILIAAATFAYLLDPVVDRLENRGHSRNTGIAIIFGLTGLGLAVFLLVMVPMIGGQFMELSGNIRVYVDNLAALIQPTAAFIEAHSGYTIPVDFDQLKAQIPEWLSQMSPDARKGIQASVGTLFASGLGLFTSIINLALLPIFTFYVLSEWDRMMTFVGDLIPIGQRDRVERLAASVDERLSAFVRGQITVCIVLAILYSVGLLFAGIDLALAIGMLAGALFIVPYLGTVVGIVLATLLCLMKYGIDIHLLYVTLAFGIPQTIESWYLTPKVVGNKVGLHPLIVMVSLLAGAGLAGVWGMLLAIPMTAVLDVLAREGLSVYRNSAVFRGGSS